MNGGITSYFPPVEQASEDGLVMVGGSLTSPRMLAGYRCGIFAWPVEGIPPMLWWSPDPRAILPIDGLHVSRRLRRRLRSGQFQFTINRAFDEVVAGCASPRRHESGTWITRQMDSAYHRLHREGHAHSIEAWSEGGLVGGVFGVAVGGLLAAESMFHRQTDASKAALTVLVAHLADCGFALIDVQMLTPHVESLGGIEIPRAQYLARLARAVDLPVAFSPEFAFDPRSL